MNVQKPDWIYMVSLQKRNPSQEVLLLYWISAFIVLDKLKQKVKQACVRI